MGGDARERIEQSVRDRIRASGVDPMRDAVAVRGLVARALDDWDEAALLSGGAPLPEREALARAVTDAVAGLGPLQPLLDDPEVEEIWIKPVYVAG